MKKSSSSSYLGKGRVKKSSVSNRKPKTGTKRGKPAY